MNVVITAGIQVVHNGEHFYGGQTIDAPARVAAQWVKYRWAVVAEDEQPRRPARRK